MTRYKIKFYNKDCMTDFESQGIFKIKDDLSKEISLEELSLIKQIIIFDEESNYTYARKFVEIEEMAHINDLKAKLEDKEIQSKKKIDILEKQLEYYKSLSEL